MKIWVKLLFIYALLMLGIGYAFQMTCEHFKEDALVQRTAFQQTGYSSVLQSNRILADTFFNEVLNRDEILVLVHKIIHSQGVEQDIQRGLLHRSLSATYQRSKNDVAEILQFHFPDNRSMLRFHLPQKADDDLTQMRPSVVAVNTEIEAVHGYESGRCLHAYRHVYPLVYQGEHIGSVEVSHPYYSIYHKVQQLEMAAHTQFIFFQKNEWLCKKLSKKDEQYYVFAELHPNYIRQRQIPELFSGLEKLEEISAEMRSLFEKLKNDTQIQAGIPLGLEFSQFVNLDRDIYSVVFHVVKNVSGQHEGYLLAITPEPQIQNLISKFWIYYFMTGFVLFGILFYRGILHVALQEKIKNQQALQTSEKRLKRAEQVAHIGNWEYDIKAKTLKWSDEVYRIFAVNSEHFELTYENFFLCIHPEDRELVKSSYHDSINNKTPYDIVHRLLLKDGTIKYIREKCDTDFDDDGFPALSFGTVQDVTQQKGVENALQDSEEYLRVLSDASFEAIFLSEKGVCLGQNRTAERIFGYSLDEAVGKPAIDWIVPEERKKVLAKMLSEDENPYETIALCKDGTPIFSEIQARKLIYQGRPVRVTALRDVTKRKQAEEERERLLQAIDQSSETIVITDTEGTIQYANPAFERITGYTCEEAIGQNPRILKGDEQDEGIYRELWETLARGEIWRGRFINKKKDGTLYTEDATISPLLDASGKTVNYVAVKRDITNEISMEEKLHRAQKMEAIGMMAGGVAHDLNNMLAGIINYPEMMLLKLPADSNLRKPLEAVRDSGQRAAAVVADLLTVARGVASSRECYDINQLIQEHLNSPEYQQLKIEHPGVVCAEQLEAEHSMIKCSVIHIKKVLMNLTLNAAEAVGDAGRIIISTCNRQIDQAEGSEKGMEPCDYVVIVVQDNGSGIADKDLKHIFEPFYTKKEMGRSGTGLGLAVVWNTVQDHHGKIFVDSSSDGTRFQLYFPICNTETSVSPETDKDENLTGSGEHILIVDDEPQLRDIASQMLKKLDYKVDSVSSGEQALEFIKETPVDLIVLDMLMEPGINGRQTYAEIIKHYPDQKAIIASGFSESDDVKMTLQLGAGGFIGKPYSMEQLGRAVKGALNE